MQAILFDFNGTLSDDEPLLCDLFGDFFRERGRPLSEEEYYEQLAGLSDPEIVRTWLGHDDPRLLDQLLHRYLQRAGDGSTVPEHVRRVIRHAAARAPLGVVSGALRPVVETVLASAGLIECFDVIVTAEDTERGKPDPAGYLLALAALGVGLEEVAAIEDSRDGVAAAKAAGLYTVGLLGTATAEQLAAVDEMVAALDLELIDRLLDQARSSR